jgi:HEAT repeat protein
LSVQRLIASAALCSLLVVGVSGGASAEEARARGGVQLVFAMERAPVTVVAKVEKVRELAGSGRSATLRVESPVVGEFTPGDRLGIAWEELAASRAPRFQTGDRVLVALEPLPGASVWLARIPDASERAATLTVAMRGDAFLPNPSPGEVLLLQHYLALAAKERAGATGVVYLAKLAAGAQLPLAEDAVVRLDARSDLDQHLSEAAVDRLVLALLRDDATPEFENALLMLIANHQPSALRARLRVLLTRLDLMVGDGGIAPRILYAALARYDDGLSAQQSAELTLQVSEGYRRIGARSASGERADDLLRSLLQSDPAASVRASAIERLVELRGDAVISSVVGALYDSDSGVRVTAAKQLGSLGASAVPELHRIADGNDLDAARAAIAGLMWSGSDAGSDALHELAAGHPDDSVRMLADLALGRKTGDRHD